MYTVGNIPTNMPSGFASSWYKHHMDMAASPVSKQVYSIGNPSRTAHDNLPISEVLRAIREISNVPKHRSYWDDGGSYMGDSGIYIRRGYPLSQFVKFYTCVFRADESGRQVGYPEIVHHVYEEEFWRNKNDRNKMVEHSSLVTS